MDANPFGDPTELDVEEANASFNLLYEDEEEDDFVVEYEIINTKTF